MQYLNDVKKNSILRKSIGVRCLWSFAMYSFAFFNRLLVLFWITSHVAEHVMFGLVYHQIFVLMLKGKRMHKINAFLSAILYTDISPFNYMDILRRFTSTYLNIK